jgi:putative endonuclease
VSDWYLYILRTASGALYTGISTSPQRRLQEHQSDPRRGARALRGKGPLELVYIMAFADRSLASKAEYRVKRLSRGDKERLVAGELALPALD